MTNNPMAMIQGMAQNPFFQIVKFAQGGGDPMQLLQQMAGSDPRAAQAMQLLQGKTAGELEKIATNMAKERGATPEEIARSLGLLQ